MVTFLFIPSYLPTISPGYTALGSIWDLNPLVVFLHAGQKVELNHSPVRSAVELTLRWFTTYPTGKYNTGHAV